MHRLKIILFLVFLFCIKTINGNAQNCHFKILGVVSDGQKQPLPGVVIQLKNDTTGSVSDIDGKFSFENICAGKYTIYFRALSYKELKFELFVNEDKNLKITLETHENELSTVTVNGKKAQELRTVSRTELSGIELLQTRGKSLGESLKDLPGLNSVQTGPTLSKPVINGLSGNRVLLINNGVRQEGQQWGTEHAPEIDPFISNKITVLKGAASVRYGSDAIAGVILVAPDEMPTQKGITGDANLVAATNGQMGGVSSTLQGAFDKSLQGLSWRVQGTIKEAGNFHTPNYYLDNTGFKEGDFSATLDYKLRSLDMSVFYSQYTTEVGIYIGAEAGSPTQLKQKFSQPKPDLPSYFTYNISRPFQTVYHDLLKAKTSYEIQGKGKIEATFGRQNDVRQEFDDLSITNSSSAYSSPQLSFQLITHTLDLIYTQYTKNGLSGSFGITGNTSGNSFQGVRYLIPNFRDYNVGAFAIERYNFKKFSFEAGVRYDYTWLRVYELNPTTLQIYHPTYEYKNGTGTIGATYKFNDKLWTSINAGSAWRAPSINELYINGEHFSDASYEIGDSALKSERSFNTGLTINYSIKKLRVSVDLYYNKINNYIFEKPALVLRTLPNGAFPVFNYTQADVNIKGIDAVIEYDILKNLTFQSKTTIVRGFNETIDNWLISMPCDRFDNDISYHLTKIGKITEPYITLEYVNVLKQIRVPPNSDFVAPPSGYALLNANAGFNFKIRRNQVNVNFSVSNITNTAYRDYLDHFRYFNDELGINYTLRLKYSF